MEKWKKIIVIILISFLITSALFVVNTNTSPEYTIKTTNISKGSISNTVTATGTLEATNTVVVGTQVSGVIEKIYVDYNSKVKKGQLLAELDKSTLLSNLENAEADILNAKAELEYQKSNYERNKKLFEKNMISESDYDLSKYNYKKSEAALKSAKANYDRAKRNLDYTKIYAPISGIVLNKAVEEGQTVAATMSTPELFTIANDLREMKVETDIDEADIGQIKEGQRVEFTVDAFPEETFSGEISQVRLQPNESSNVITYTAIVSVKNNNLKLKPGMTASITVYVEEVNDVLIINEQAAEFFPKRELLEGYLNSLPEDKTKELSINRPLFPLEKLSSNKKIVWVKNGDLIKPTTITTGMSDGINIEVVSGLKEGDEVVLTINSTSNSSETNSESNDTKNPFVPERPKNGGPPPGR